ncbi:MAG: hypothetical protein JW864_00625 [Spirochaetes bacterium]|nr:hypothetical protein [Spirochaetota bacterium]
MDKIVMSLVSYEKNKKLANKNLSDFYTLVKKRYPNIALVTIADSNNKILKAGKDDRFLKSTKTFDAIIDSFTRDEFTPGGGKDLFIRYYDHNRFYISVRNIDGGKILAAFPYKLEAGVIIQLGLELLLILIISIILTAIIIILKNQKTGSETVRMIKKEKELSEKQSGKEIRKAEESVKENKIEFKNILSDIDIDSLNDSVYEIFKDIVQDYKPKNLSLYLNDKEREKLYKVYELKGNIFAKVDDLKNNFSELTEEISEALKKSSIILKQKGCDVTIPVLYKFNLMGILNFTREEQFTGPEINEIRERLNRLVEPLSKYYT